ITLRDVRWCEDLAVSGELDWPGRSGTVTARLALAAPAGPVGELEASWPEGVSHARATARGSFAGTMVAAEAPAP
ncbi:MAG: hypothetical protein JO361_10630, partial [Gammaproteobacteria bacterium]|nr:hypothetical protein [Gammaproteobacteria bacterium]